MSFDEWIVYSNDFNIRLIDCRAEEEASNSAKAVNANLQRALVAHRGNWVMLAALVRGKFNALFLGCWIYYRKYVDITATQRGFYNIGAWVLVIYLLLPVLAKLDR